jgi:hypothetical protein
MKNQNQERNAVERKSGDLGAHRQFEIILIKDSHGSRKSKLANLGKKPSLLSHCG